MMSVLEREVRLLVPADVVDFTGASERLELIDLYFVRGNKFSIRLRSERSKEAYRLALTFKFWNGTDTIEEHCPLTESKGQALFAAANRYGVERVEKVRYVFSREDSLVWEVDLYAPPVDFFVIAECEYKSEVRPPDLALKPSWYRGKDWPAEYVDITTDLRFFEFMLSRDTVALRRYIADGKFAREQAAVEKEV